MGGRTHTPNPQKSFSFYNSVLLAVVYFLFLFVLMWVHLTATENLLRLLILNHIYTSINFVFTFTKYKYFLMFCNKGPLNFLGWGWGGRVNIIARETVQLITFLTLE